MTIDTKEDNAMRRFELKRSTPYGTLTVPVEISASLARDEPFLAAMTVMQAADEAEAFAVEQRRKELEGGE